MYYYAMAGGVGHCYREPPPEQGVFAGDTGLMPATADHAQALTSLLECRNEPAIALTKDYHILAVNKADRDTNTKR